MKIQFIFAHLLTANNNKVGLYWWLMDWATPDLWLEKPLLEQDNSDDNRVFVDVFFFKPMKEFLTVRPSKNTETTKLHRTVKGFWDNRPLGTICKRIINCPHKTSTRVQECLLWLVGVFVLSVFLLVLLFLSVNRVLILFSLERCLRACIVVLHNRESGSFKDGLKTFNEDFLLI